jgi:hypothetical protein
VVKCVDSPVGYGIIATIKRIKASSITPRRVKMTLKEEYIIQTLAALIQKNGYYEGIEKRAVEIVNRLLDTMATES